MVKGELMDSVRIPEIVIIGGTVVEITIRCAQFPSANQGGGWAATGGTGLSLRLQGASGQQARR